MYIYAKLYLKSVNFLKRRFPITLQRFLNTCRFFMFYAYFFSNGSRISVCHNVSLRRVFTFQGANYIFRRDSSQAKKIRKLLRGGANTNNKTFASIDWTLIWKIYPNRF